MTFPDFHNGRKPIPYTRKEYETWAKERVVGRAKFVWSAALSSGVAFALIGIAAIISLLMFSNRPMPQSWPITFSLSAIGLAVFGIALGWFISNTTWSISEARFAATNPQDLDDENLNTQKLEQDRMAITVIPFVLGLVVVLLLPEKYGTIGFIGAGATMVWFGYIALSSKVEPTESTKQISRSKIWFIFLLGMCMLVVASYLTIMAALS